MMGEHLRMTKIVCTIGPSSESARVLEALIRGGMNIARLNFSHGTHQEHLKKIHTIRRISDRLKQPVAILQDLGGPKVRVGLMKGGGAELKRGKEFRLTRRVLVGDAKQASVTYPLLPDEVKPGDRILLADGTIQLQVIDSDGNTIRCRVVVGGVLTSHKGMNFPTRTPMASAFTEKDQKDLLFGIRHGVDWISLSYVQRAGDIDEVKKFLREKSVTTPVIAKIERREALENIDEILVASDGIMVARGDLGLETPIEKIPNVQKALIRKANASAKPVITATQMLRSMVDHPQPTRAEVTDVVNAIYDGTDAIMLSEETASGQFPVEAFKMMDKIARSAEEEFPHDPFLRTEGEESMPLQQAITYTASLLAERVGAKVIVTPTESGSTARWVSKFRPRQPVLALSRNFSTVKELNLSWGVHPVLGRIWKDTDEMFERSKRISKELGMSLRGEKIVVIAGVPVGIPGNTNLIKVEVID